MTKISSLLVLPLLLACCGKTVPNDLIEDLDTQRIAKIGSLASVAGHPEGLVITLKGSEYTPQFSKTKTQKNLYQNTLKAMQGMPYSVDPSGQTVYTDWFDNDQGKPTKITVLVSDQNITVNVFTKHNGQAVKDTAQAQTLTHKIRG